MEFLAHKGFNHFNISLQLCLVMSLAHGKYKIQPLHLSDKGVMAFFKGDVLGEAIPLRYDRQNRLDLLVQLDEILLDCLFPYEGILIGICFDLGSVHKQIPVLHLAHFVKLHYKLIKQILNHLCQMSSHESGYGGITRRRLAVQ